MSAGKSNSTGNFLRRYTELPFLFHLLQEKKLTLLNPQSWDDKNDSHLVESYRRSKNLQSVFALCFTEAPETYHHWKVFSGNSSGVCIEFKKARLLNSINELQNLRHGNVNYKTIKSIRQATPAIDQLPFLKRYPFRDEKEYRLIYENTNESVDSKEIDFDFNAVSKIVINPWMPEKILVSVKNAIHNLTDCNSLRIHRTTIVNNDEWKQIGDLAT